MEKLADLLEKLATQLGVTAEYLWPLLVKQTQVRWLAGMTTAVLILAVSLPSLRHWWRRYDWAVEAAAGRPYLERETAGDRFIPWLAVSAIVSMIALVIFLSHLTSIEALFAPEAATVERLLKLVR